jgi:TolA-binding protein
VNTFNKLWMATAITLLVAGPAYPQSKNDILLLNKDVLDLKNAMNQLQQSMDQKNAAMQGLLEQIYDQVNSMAGSIQKINQTVESVNTRTDKASADFRTQMTALSTKVNELSDTVSALRSQFSGLSQQITTMNTTTEALPGIDESWRNAYGDVALFGNYELGLQELADFEAKYPNDPRVAQAQILKGDAYRALQKYDQAIIEYDTFLQKYPDNEHTTDALYKKGLAQIEVDPKAATATLNLIITKYKGSPEATLAQQKLREIAGARGRRGPGRQQ